MLYSLKYTDNIPVINDGITKLWFIKIRPKYQNDEGLLEHEKTHVWQFWRTCGLHIFFWFSKKYRISCEQEAYKNQLTYPPASEGEIDTYRHIYAGFIANPERYGFDITEEEAYKLLL